MIYSTYFEFKFYLEKRTQVALVVSVFSASVGLNSRFVARNCENYIEK